MSRNTCGEVSKSLNWELHLNLAEFDEASFQAISYETGITVDYGPAGSPWGNRIGFSYAGLSGRNDAARELRLSAALTYSIGRTGGTAPKTRMFRMIDPVEPLIRRDLW